MRISDWSSDVCSSDLRGDRHSFEDVLTAMLMPIIHVFSARDRMLYARFMMRLLPLDEDEHPYFKALHLCGPSVEIQRRLQYCLPHLDRKSVVEGKGVSVSVVPGGRRIFKKKNTTDK